MLILKTYIEVKSLDLISLLVNREYSVEYSVNNTKPRKETSLSPHYNATNNFSNVSGIVYYQFNSNSS